MERVQWKAKSVKNGKWFEGTYYEHHTRQLCPMGDDKLKKDEIQHLLIYDGFADWNMPKPLSAEIIDPKTLCRCSNLRDCKGKMIFENDIVCFVEEPTIIGIVKYGKHSLLDYGWYIEWNNSKLKTWNHRILHFLTEIKVIGNTNDE